MVRLWAANTDADWFDFLAAQPEIDEVNFWQPSGGTRFMAIRPGELFLFKLKSPRNAIGGFGVFSQASNLPLSLAWEAFGIKNGAPTLELMRQRIDRYRPAERHDNDYTIGCRVVVQPVFFPESHWVEQPDSWKNQTVRGKVYDTETTDGRQLWHRIIASAQLAHGFWDTTTTPSHVRDIQTPYSTGADRYGEPRLIRPRLGQGAFRLAVTDAYKRQCAITGGRVLPALDAAHIRSYHSGGEHEVSNGILLRRDIHSVFDAGYATLDDDLRLVVSERVKTDYNNGNEYRRLHGQKLTVPPAISARPNPEHLHWHRNHVYLG